MHLERTAANRRGFPNEIKIQEGLIYLNHDTFSFDFKFTAKEFGNNNAQYKYTLHGDFMELLTLINDSIGHNKYNLEQRDVSSAKLFDKKVEAEVNRRMTEYIQSISDGK